MNSNAQLTVWIVEDDASVRWVLEKALGAESIATRSFENAVDFLSAAETAQPDVVITDIRMPGMDGLEMMRRLKGVGKTLPVIVMTAFGTLEVHLAF